jgi:hypothetical protein
MPRLISEYSICSWTIRCFALALSDGLCAHLREPDVAHVAGFHQIRDRADGVLDGHVRVAPRRLIEIDVVRLQPLQRVRQRRLHRGRPRIVPEPRAVGPALRAELHLDERLLPLSGERLAEEHLVVAHPIEVAGVEQRDAGVEGGMDGGDTLAVVGRAIHPRHSHAAEPHRGNRRTASTQRARLHGAIECAGPLHRKPK